MRKIIEEKLKEIERSDGVRILYSSEAGSRAWGFDSPDSDYDVRFVYVRAAEEYLRLDKPRDVIEWQLDETLDINGWDLSKALGLLHKSNMTLFEWNASPIVYKSTKEWEKISPALASYFNVRAALSHYLGIAERNYSQYLSGERVRLKKYFYALRPLLACASIIKNGTPPPITLDRLIGECPNMSVRGEIERLLLKKRSATELGESERVALLDSYIRENISAVRARINSLPQAESKGFKELNSLFISVVTG